MPSDPRKECPSCLRDACEGGRECYARLCAMQAVAPDMVRLLERLVAAWDDASSYDVMLDVLDGAKALLLRAKGDPQ